MKRRIALSLIFALALGVQAAPLTLKELEFLIRQRLPDAEIMDQVKKRKLLAPLDAATTEELKQNGAADSLLRSLSAPGIALSPEEARAEQQRQAALQAKTEQAMAADEEAHAALEKSRRRVDGVNAARGKTAEMLDGKLVKLTGDQFTPVSGRDLSNVRVFGFYYGAMWAPPSRQFTPKLVQAYKRLKQQYGDQFEIIFFSRDYDEFNMRQCMKNDQMAWPAVRFGAEDDWLKQFAPNGLPWLVAVNSAGAPMTMNGVDKKFIDPNSVLAAMEELLAKGAR